MANEVQASLQPPVLQALPDGSAVQALVLIRNTSPIVEQYRLEIDDLAAEWFTLPTNDLSLFPQDQGQVILRLHPPKGQARAGNYPFAISVISNSSGTASARLQATLVVTATPGLEADVSPRKVTGRRGRYTLRLRDTGNTDLDVELEAVDAEDACDCTFHPDAAHMEPGERSTVTLVVKPRRSNFVGQRKQFDVQVQVRPTGAPPKTLQVQLVHAPRLRTWRPIRRLILLLLLIGIIVLVFQALGGSPGIQAHLQDLKPPACERLQMFCPSPTTTPRASATPRPSGTPQPTATVPPTSAPPTSAPPTIAAPPTAAPLATTAPPSGAGGAGGSHGGGSNGAGGAGGAGGSPGGGGGSGSGGQGQPTAPRSIPTPHSKVLPTATRYVAPTWTPVPTSTPIPSTTPTPDPTPVPDPPASPSAHTGMLEPRAGVPTTV